MLEKESDELLTINVVGGIIACGYFPGPERQTRTNVYKSGRMLARAIHAEGLQARSAR